MRQWWPTSNSKILALEHAEQLAEVQAAHEAANSALAQPQTETPAVNAAGRPVGGQR